MVQLAKSKIEELTYKDADSNKELDKRLGAAIFIIRSDARSISPIQPEYVTAISTLSDIQDSKKTDFDKKKVAILTAINTLITDKEKWNKGNPNVNELMYGKPRYSAMNEMEYELLMVEQNNIDFFKDRESHLQSQPHDRLSSHMITSWGANNIVRWDFLQNSGLTDSIKEQVNNSMKQFLVKYQQ